MNEMSREVLRTEQKYLIDAISYRQSLRYFSQLLTPDTHNGESGYCIRSLYFDTLCNQDYADKINGLELRKKIRLRIYSPHSSTAVLEMKQKQGTHQKKRSLVVQKSLAEQMMGGNYSGLLALNNAFALECFIVLNEGLYRPKAVVEYRRQAFITHEANTRVTFDTALQTCETNFDLFAETLPLVPAMDSALAVLEIKYNGFLLSYIQEAVNHINKSALSVSKYCAGRQLLQ